MWTQSREHFFSLSSDIKESSKKDHISWALKGEYELGARREILLV
jgi:hypothetical protein